MKLKNIILMAATFILMFSCVERIHLVPFEENGLWGYKNQNNETVIPAQYFMANEFLETGIAAVADSSGWMYIDQTGRKIIRPYIIDNGPDYFSEGLARFKSDEKFGFYDHTGKIIIPAEWDFARPFSNGLAAICEGCIFVRMDEHTRIEGGHWGFIDKFGKIIIPVQFEEVRDFVNEHAKVKLDGEWKLIDKNGMFSSSSSN